MCPSWRELARATTDSQFSATPERDQSARRGCDDNRETRAAKQLGDDDVARDTVTRLF